MLTLVENREWVPGQAGDNFVVQAPDFSTINRVAVTCDDRAFALRLTSEMLRDGGYCVIATSRNNAGDAWLALCTPEGTVPAEAGPRRMGAAVPQPMGAVAASIGESVGHAGVNRAEDVVLVKEMLNALGFGFFAISGRVDPGLISAIRLFQSIISGKNRVGGIDGRIDVGGVTWQSLENANAPRWQLMPDRGTGFINIERQDENDKHDYGTSWLAQTITGAGETYNRDYLANHVAACPLTINDVSLPHGGDTPDHAGHETGLACDLRLPRVDGGSGGIQNPNTNQAYDRNAMRAQLLALREQPLFKRAFFNDKVLISEGLCEQLSGHGNHLHFEVESPLLPQ